MVGENSEERPRRRGRSPKVVAPASGSPPPDSSEDPILGAMRAVFQEQLALVITHVDDQINGVQAKVASLEQRIPSVQSLVDQTAAVLGPAISKQISEKLSGMVAGGANGHREAGDTEQSQELVSRAKPSLSDKVTGLTDMVGAVADVVLQKFYPLYLDHRKEARLDRQESRADKMMDTNPFMVAETMRASNSPLLPMYAAAFAPTPQVVAEARVRETTDALVVGMRARAEASRVLKEDQQRQRETPSPNSPNSSGSPTGTSAPSTINPNEPKTDGVTMTGKSSRPRLPLHEVMG